MEEELLFVMLPAGVGNEGLEDGVAITETVMDPHDDEADWGGSIFWQIGRHVEVFPRGLALLKRSVPQGPEEG